MFCEFVAQPQCIYVHVKLLQQWRSWNAENITRNKRRLLDQAMLLFNFVHF